MAPNGEVAVVTGAARGIGLAIASRLATAGYRVLITDIDHAEAEKAAARLGDSSEGVQQDVREPDSHRLVAERAQRMGTLRLWVNNAGVLYAGECWTQTDEEIERLLGVNFRGVVSGSRTAVDVMSRTGGGTVLNIASISALTPVPGLALYAASKAAVLSFTTSLEGDLRRAGLPIRAKALCPDVVRTGMVTDRATDPGASMLFSGPAPLDPRRVADAAITLLEGRQVFEVVPRWRGALVRAADLAPSIGLTALGLMRRIGDHRQRRAPASTTADNATLTPIKEN